MTRRMTAKPRLIRSMSRRTESDRAVGPSAPLVSMAVKKAEGMVRARTLLSV